MGFMDSVQNFSENLWQQGTVPPEVAECDKVIADLDQKNDMLIKEIGQIYVRDNTVESAEGTPYEDAMKNLKAVSEQKEAVFKKKLSIQGLRMCENCGNVLSLDSLFCNKCGGKLEPIQQIENETGSAGRFCPKCGATVDDDSDFCVKCGNKL